MALFFPILADLYTPTLVLVVVMQQYRARQQIPRAVFRARVLRCVGSLVAVYLLSALDTTLQLWPAFALDYSTHTAVALVWVLEGSLRDRSSKQTSLLIPLLLWLSFFGYLALMRMLNYHSWADMITTALVVIGMWWCAHLLTCHQISKTQTEA